MNAHKARFLFNAMERDQSDQQTHETHRYAVGFRLHDFLDASDCESLKGM
jgi:hypothetical protein